MRQTDSFLLHQGQFRFLFQSSVSALLLGTSRGVRSLELCIAEALQRLFPGASIAIITRFTDGSEKSPEKACISGAQSFLTSSKTLTAHGCTALLAGVPGSPVTTVPKAVLDLMEVRIFQAPTKAVAFLFFNVDTLGTREELWILLNPPMDDHCILAAAWLERSISSLRELYATISALKGTSHSFRLQQNLAELRTRRTTVLSRRLGQGIALIKEIRFYGTRQPNTNYPVMLETCGLWVLQEILGTEWHTRSSDASWNERVVSDFFEALGDALEETYKSVSDAGFVGPEGGLATRPFSLLRVFRAIGQANDRGLLQDLAAVLNAEFEDADFLSLLLVWSRWHELARAQAFSPQSVQDGWWKESIAKALPFIDSLLRKGWEPDRSEHQETIESDRPGLHSLSAWLNLWLARQLMVEIIDGTEWKQERSLLDVELWQFRSHLAFVLRESIRQSLFGHWFDFTFDPASYIEAVTTLVEHHAYYRVGIDPGWALGRILKEIGKARHADDYPFAISHQQHALQMYVLGHFLAELEIEAPAAPFRGRSVTMKALLASSNLEPAPADVQDRFLQSFSLAVLLHDIGMLLFPRIFFPALEVANEDDKLVAGLEGIQEGIHQSAKELLANCEEQLSGIRGLFREDEGNLAGWLKEQIRVGAADHSLLGAWYLYRLSKTTEERERLKPSRKILEGARAILLHQVVTQDIETKDDPVAALLVLCDEIFDWLPSRKRRSSIHAGSIRGGAQELDVRPEGSRAKWIYLPQLALSSDDMSPHDLRWKLRLTQEDLDNGWPTVEIHLKEPDHLDQPTWQIWLQVFQNLARINQGQHGWRPFIRVISTIPGELQQVGLHTQSLLARWASSSRKTAASQLRNWLVGPYFDSGEESPTEALSIPAGMRRYFTKNISRDFYVMDEQLDTILRAHRHLEGDDRRRKVDRS